jgi:GT2 family glycosyltransferase
MGSLLGLPQTADFLALGHNLAFWRWQFLPWDRQTIDTASALAKLSTQSPLPAWTLEQSHVNQHFVPAILAIAEGRADAVAELWMKHGATSGHSTWLGETCLFFMQLGDEARARMVLETTTLPDNHPVCLHLQALLAFCYALPESAILTIRNLPEEFRWIRSLLEAQCLLRLGDRAGTVLLQKLWREIPWHPNLTLKLHDLLVPKTAPAPPNADTAVLIYSWNNADLLEKTLQSLAESSFGAASVLILDNGSADHTPTVVQASAQLFAERLKSFRLPVNIGAPGARNWLLRHPETSRFRRLAFVDDDVLLPPDWLGELAAHARRSPRGTIVGCRIMDQSPRRTVQVADVNLLAPDPDGEFLIANAGCGELDLGLHEYTRPCLSVTGCCHLLDRERAEELGGFDLRFNPSQFDDFELDLRNALGSGHAFYAGRTAIRHCQRSSLSQADSDAKQGHIQGNLLKLNSKYTPEQKAELLCINRKLLWDDLLAKTRDLENL